MPAAPFVMPAAPFGSRTVASMNGGRGFPPPAVERRDSAGFRNRQLAARYPQIRQRQESPYGGYFDEGDVYYRDYYGDRYHQDCRYYSKGRGGTFEKYMARRGVGRYLARPGDFGNVGPEGPAYYDRRGARYDRGYYGDRDNDEERGFFGKVANTAIDLTLVAGQLTLLSAVLSAPLVPEAASVSEALGLFCLFSGGFLAVNGALKLDGVYEFCRHPIYAGLITACVGIGFWSESPEQLLSRVLLTGALSCVLGIKADREEARLERCAGMG